MCYDSIRSIKEELAIPVIGNGGISKVAGIIVFKDSTRCNGLMIGSGALQNPFLAQDYREYLSSGKIPVRNTVASLINFAQEYASQICVLRGSASRLYHSRGVLHFFALLVRIKVFVARCSQ